MYTNNLVQLENLIYFIIVGIFLGVIFDIFRILRKTIKTADFVTNVEDIIFCLISGSIVLYSIFYFNNGELRFYIFLSITVGVTIYIKFFSKYFIKTNICIINFNKKVLNNILIKTIRLFCKFTKKVIFRPISFIFINIKENIFKITKMIYNFLKKSYNKKDFKIKCRKI